MNYDILVNKEKSCPDNLNLKIININSRYAPNRKAEEQTYLAFKKLQEHALKSGFDIDIESGYRSKEQQTEIFNECIKLKGIEHTKKYVAVPSYSEHQTGLALDICLKQNDIFLIEHDLPESFNKFIENNVKDYGFIIRYPLGKERITGYNYEPWHIRYVGKELAIYLTDNNLTLEEYYKKRITNQ